MQQFPVRTLQLVTSCVRAARGVRARWMAGTTAVALLAGWSFAGPTARSRFPAHGSFVRFSAGSVARAFAPALPGRALRITATHPAVPADAPPVAVPPVAVTARERLALGAPGTYIGEILRVRDSAVVRWPERVERPLTVWVATAAGRPDWHPAYLARVADAFAEWTRTGVPVRFRFVQDSSTAEVHVGWTDRFREPISGRTVWSRDEHWWMTDANITLALHHSDGTALDEDQVRAIALHEIGHLLGLDHTSDPMSVMAARVRVRELSNADQATVRLVYALPAGHL